MPNHFVTTNPVLRPQWRGFAIAIADNVAEHEQALRRMWDDMFAPLTPEMTKMFAGHDIRLYSPYRRR